jgi:hypothetical protein
MVIAEGVEDALEFTHKAILMGVLKTVVQNSCPPAGILEGP